MNTRIKSIALFLFTFLLSFFSLAVNTADSVKDIRIKIEEESFIIIHGKTNVNKFQCRYDELSPGKTINLKLAVSDECMIFENAELNLESKKFDCGNKTMNNDFMDLLKSDQFPFIGIDILCINIGSSTFKTVPVKLTNKSAVVYTNFKIAGSENEYHIPVDILEKGKKRIYTGEMMINVRDFGIQPPKKMLGMIEVEENILIQFHLVISLVN